ncbi:UNKNOWN [Stylonychia lemnae]|uniref:Uncharacterized protein n=1 Tax=Stylonychia lemnae TaxID=5949 RepID=A0A078B0I0_STYLE|nr:UNKNOWN [Stylonychia lemnae]|eukprot:CDW88034.1 UNKNOWN [Stylonychia lemnae]
MIDNKNEEEGNQVILTHQGDVSEAEVSSHKGSIERDRGGKTRLSKDHALFQIFILPNLKQDYLHYLGVDNPWKSSIEKELNYMNSLVITIVFSIAALLLFISLVKTIITNPGHIPEDREWDIYSGNSTEEDEKDYLCLEKFENSFEKQPKQIIQKGNYEKGLQKENSIFIGDREITYLTNDGIKEDMCQPVEPSHFDLKYLSGYEGPLYQDIFHLDLGENSDDKHSLLQRSNNKKLFAHYQSFERKKFGGMRMCQSQIDVIIVHNAISVYLKWIITAHGQPTVSVFTITKPDLENDGMIFDIRKDLRNLVNKQQI